MKRHLRFQAANNSQVKQQIIQYFDQSGFKNIGEDDNTLKFKRGSSVLDLWKFNPLRWGSEITVCINAREVEANFIIDTSAKIVNTEVKEVWNVFVNNLKQYVVNGVSFEKANSEAVDNARMSILKTYAKAILGMIGGGIIGGIIDYLIGSYMIVYYGFVLGTLFIMKNKEENSTEAFG